MAKGFKFDMTEWKRAAKAAAKAVPKKLLQRRNQFLTGASALYASGIASEAPVFMGELHNAWGSHVEGLEKAKGAKGQIYVQGPAQRYAEVVDEGREPGTFPNLQAIRRFVDLKIKRGEMAVDVEALFPGRKKKPNHAQIVNTLAYLIGRSIAQKGTKANPYISRGLKLKEEDVQDLLDELSKKLTKDIEGAMGK